MCRILFFILLIACSCRSSKSLEHSDWKDSAIYMGVIHMNESGCPYFIEITNCDVSNYSDYIGKKVYPVELEDQFRKEGIKVRFNFNISKAPSPADCQIDYVISLGNVSVVLK